MLRIGEFSSISGISIYMLRNYDKIGLLVPEHVDEESGYRYYGEEQIIKANGIQVLKGLGFQLKEIRRIFQEKDSGKDIEIFLKGKIKEKEAELERIKSQIREMESALLDIERQEECVLSVAIKRIPERKVASLRGIIQRFSDEGVLWQRLNDECEKMKVKFVPVDYSMSVTHSVDFKNSIVDVEVQRVVEELMKDTEVVKFKEIPSMKVATMAFKGIYSKLGNIYGYMNAWVKKNGYKICGLAFSTYYISPGNEKNPDNFITEVSYPIKKL